MSKIELLFDALPTFESTPMFFTLDDGVDNRLKTLDGTYARCNAALRFTSMVGAGTDILHVRDDELASMRVAYLRAALMEFAGMEEALGCDLDGSSPPLRIRDTKNAMLVVLRELRNIQIHLVGTEFRAEKRRAVLRRAGMDGTDHETELTALMIPRDDLQKLKDPRNSSRYGPGDFVSAVDWLANAQEHWGICDVVLRGIWAYAQAIVDAHVPAA